MSDPTSILVTAATVGLVLALPAAWVVVKSLLSMASDPDTPEEDEEQIRAITKGKKQPGIVNIKITYGIGYGSHETDMDVPDDMTDDEINEEIWEMLCQRLDYGWERVQQGGDDD